MKNMSLMRAVGIVLIVSGMIKSVINYEAILNDVGPATFILGFAIFVIAIMVLAFPEAKREDC